MLLPIQMSLTQCWFCNCLFAHSIPSFILQNFASTESLRWVNACSFCSHVVSFAVVLRDFPQGSPKSVAWHPERRLRSRYPVDSVTHLFEQLRVASAICPFKSCEAWKWKVSFSLFQHNSSKLTFYGQLNSISSCSLASSTGSRNLLDDSMLNDDKKSSNGKFRALQFLGTLTRDVFDARTATGIELLSYLTCLHTTSFIILNTFLLLKTISLKFWERPLLTFSLSVEVRGPKTSLAGDERGPPLIWSKQWAQESWLYERRSCRSRLRRSVDCRLHLQLDYFLFLENFLNPWKFNKFYVVSTKVVWNFNTLVRQTFEKKWFDPSVSSTSFTMSLFFPFLFSRREGVGKKRDPGNEVVVSYVL